MYEDLMFQKCPKCGTWLYRKRKFHEGITGALAKDIKIIKDSDGDSVYVCNNCQAKLVHVITKGKPLVYRYSHSKQ
ncbi:MAG: hypothetical protein PHN32_01130 [Actinomycetota bacterium]|jgi:uncharacterized C2H2 Zn-finger protein|nr:hypothetical protein [Actinomycetota bacterium]